MSEDERTLWCGNLSENVTEEMLYELFLQAGPLENVKIPRDGNGRQRSYAFITYTHACSVEYAIGIFQGTSLLQRHLSLDRKTRNAPNAVPTPQISFNYPTGNSNTAANQRYSDDPPLPQAQQNTMDEGNDFQSPDTNQSAFHASHSQSELLSAMMAITGGGGPSRLEFTPEMLAQLGQHMLGADYPPFDDGTQQQRSLRTKMKHKDHTNNYHERHQKKPYSRENRYGHKHERNESQQHQSRHRYDGNNKRKSGDHERNYDRNGDRRRR
ncbi:RNA-binding protein 7 [Anopheles maculipalpis]|uniref:RNA-binding protein 7 n=1 Tax=Anopheles maculipalpis TaxID=1496333 RepID=UPI00215977DF|nr:RNA-binding protein 7 [Anopheles maculipalpis]